MEVAQTIQSSLTFNTRLGFLALFLVAVVLVAPFDNLRLPFPFPEPLYTLPVATAVKGFPFRKMG